MDIYLTDLEVGDTFQFPMLPETISTTMGNQFASYSILGIGEIKVPSGVSLDTISWDGIFPGEHRQYQPYIKNWVNPLEAFKWLENCKAQVGKSKKLRLLVTETALNIDVYLDSVTKTYSQGYGDINYQISLVQAKDLIVTATSSTTATDGTSTTDSSGTRPSPPESTTYTVVSGDSLWAIAQKLLGNGSRYPEIYEANSSTIDERNSGTGNSKYTIYAGQIFTIPS